MAKTARKAAVMVAAGLLLVAPRISAAADAPTVGASAPVRHVRSTSPAINGLIEEATNRSAAFRALVDMINASDSIVFVNEGDCRHGVRACFVSVTAGDKSRFMVVLVDTRKRADWDLMGSIGHELRHTIEVIDAPHVRDNATKFFFYEQIGQRGINGTSETNAAVNAGNIVRSEVRKSARQAQSE